MEQRVLLLEHDTDVRNVLLEAFRFEGFAVTVCQNVADLERAVRDTPGSVIVSGSWVPRSPQLDNVQRAEIVRLGKLAPVVLIPSQPWASEVVPDELGVTILTMPFDLDELLQAVREARPSAIATRS